MTFFYLLDWQRYSSKPRGFPCSCTANWRGCFALSNGFKQLDPKQWRNHYGNPYFLPSNFTQLIFLRYQMIQNNGVFQRIPLVQSSTPASSEVVEEEPLYVNAKQYHRILKRRQARGKLEAEGRLPKERKVRVHALAFDAIVAIMTSYFRNIFTNLVTNTR